MRVIVWFFIGAVLVAVVWGVFLHESAPHIAPGSVLLIDVQGEYIEAPEPPLLARALGAKGTPFLRLYSALRKAELDPRIYAVVLRISPAKLGWAKAQEVRDALARLRKAGRKTVAYVETEPTNANLSYYMASAADEVWAAPGTRIPFVGLAAEYMYLGGLFDKLGINLEVERVGPHKTAADFLAGHGMSEPAREMANWLLDSTDSQFLDGIAESRKMKPEAVQAIVQQAPSAPADLEKAGLIDHVGFLSDVLKELGKDRQLVKQDEWARVTRKSLGFDPKVHVALIYGSGNVVTGEGQHTRRGGPVLAGRTVSKAIEDAADDDNIQAILFRIDSPGGSALAADEVWHATQLARAKKPVVVSFSDVAASGGYYVACGANAIVAQPGTITGSIGVLMIRPVLAGLYQKLGIATQVLTRGDDARLFTTSLALTPEERKRLGAEVERTYQLFLDRVVAGRGIDRAALDKVSRGRVWTGEQAKARGLVDELGGLYTAVARVRKELGVAPSTDVSLVVYPPPQPLAAQLTQMVQGAMAQAMGPGLPLPGPLKQTLSWLEALPANAPVLVPPLALEIH